MTDAFGSPAPDPALIDLVGNRYRIEGRLGRGGYADVFLVRRATDDLRLALKVSRPGERRRIGLLWEAECVRRVSSPLVGEIYEVGELLDGRGYFIRDFIDGVPLHRILAKRAIVVQDAVRVAARIGRTLCVMHAQGLLHRDIKPANILVPVAGDGSLRPWDARLLDLGIAGIGVPHGGGGELRAAPGFALGTAHYMAPEVFLGRASTPATDVYGLGILLFEMFFAKPPMAEEPVEQTAKGPSGFRMFTGALVKRRVAEDIIIPSNRALPFTVAELLRAMLRRDPRQRPALPEVILPALDAASALLGTPCTPSA